MEGKRTISYGILAASLACCLLAQAADDGVLESYAGSRDLPDEIAYAEFLNFVGVPPESAADGHVTTMMVAEALGLDAVQDARLVALRAGAFRWQLDAMEREERRAGRQLLCRGGPDSRSDEELFDALNAVDDLARLVRQKYLLLAQHSLPRMERASFAAYLDEFKESVSYTRYDSRRHVGQSAYAPSPAEMAAEICRSYRSGAAAITERS